MSKIGNKPIIIPIGIKINVIKNNVIVKSSINSLSINTKHIKVILLDNKIYVKLLIKKPKNKKYHGLYRSLINNMIIGVSKGFTKELVLNGVGYKANKNKNILELNIGFSHLIYIEIPKCIKVDVFNQQKI